MVCHWLLSCVSGYNNCGLNLLIGKDGTAAFEDVGHSSDARDLMKQYQIGVLADVSELS